MNSTVLNQPWLDQNGQRAYPLADWASRTDTTGTFRIPDDFLLACYLRLPRVSGFAPGRFYVSSLASYPGGYVLAIGYDPGTPEPVATVAIDRSTHAEYAGYRLAFTGRFADADGHVVVGRLEGLDAQPGGLFRFGREAGQLMLDCVRPAIRGLRGVRIAGGGSVSPLYDGILELAAGRNARVGALQEGETITVRYDAIDGAGTVTECDCGGSGAATRPAITSINGLGAAGGNFTISGNGCLQLNPAEGGLGLVDRCSTPCCGCKETEAVVNELSSFRDARLALERRVALIEARVAEYERVLLASRIETRECQAP